MSFSVLDALGKPQSGLLAGNVGWFGSYSECTKMVVGAHYCLAYLQIPAIIFTEVRLQNAIVNLCSSI